MITLCKLDEIEDGGSFGAAYGEVGPSGMRRGAILVRRGDTVFAYENSCPHIGVPLDFTPGKFLTQDRALIICATHGALFRIEDGECISGPCAGDALRPLEVQIIDGNVRLNLDVGS